MTEKIIYNLMRDAGLGFYQVHSFDSQEGAEAYAKEVKSTIDEVYKVIRVQIVETELPAFVVSAYIPTIVEIAEDIIAFADGSYSIDWGNDYDNLSKEDQTKVLDMVYAEVACCDECGWHFHKDNLEEYDGECICRTCANARDLELEEED